MLFINKVEDFVAAATSFRYLAVPGRGLEPRQAGLGRVASGLGRVLGTADKTDFRFNEQNNALSG